MEHGAVPENPEAGWHCDFYGTEQGEMTHLDCARHGRSVLVGNVAHNNHGLSRATIQLTGGRSDSLASQTEGCAEFVVRAQRANALSVVRKQHGLLFTVRWTISRCRPVNYRVGLSIRVPGRIDSSRAS